jgi:Ca-activated chloride channel family protein
VAKPAAEEHYEQAIAEGDTAIMLEQVQPGLYTMNVGNILAGEEVRLTIRSAELLAWQDNLLRFRLPTTIAPRYGSAEQAGLQPHQVPDHDLFAEHRLQIRVRLLGPMTKAQVASPTHPIVVDQLPTETVVALAPGHMALDRDFILYIDRAADQHSVLVEREGEGGYVALASFVPQMPTSASLPPKNIKIMVDCSGSMAGDAITQARQAISDILQHLRPEDFFNIVARAFFAQQVPATAKNITAVRRQLRSLEADMGGTEMGEALQLAIHLAGSTLPPDMLLITDGQIWEFASLVQKARDSGHRVFTVGVGSAVAEPFVRCLPGIPAVRANW